MYSRASRTETRILHPHRKTDSPLIHIDASSPPVEGSHTHAFNRPVCKLQNTLTKQAILPPAAAAARRFGAATEMLLDLTPVVEAVSLSSIGMFSSPIVGCEDASMIVTVGELKNSPVSW